MESRESMEKKMKTRKRETTTTIDLEDNYDILVEVLKHLDARSLGISACVSKLWNNICSMESLWEHLCNRHCTTHDADPAAAAQLRSVVLAMGGYRRLYLLCIRPLLDRLSSSPRQAPSEPTKDQVQLSLSLFSIHCYERLGKKLGDCSSLLFLCNSSVTAAQTGGAAAVCCVASATANHDRNH